MLLHFFLQKVYAFNSPPCDAAEITIPVVAKPVCKLEERIFVWDTDVEATSSAFSLFLTHFLYIVTKIK